MSSLTTKVELASPLPSDFEEITRTHAPSGASTLTEPPNIDLSAVDTLIPADQSSKEQHECATPLDLSTVDNSLAAGEGSKNKLHLSAVDRNKRPTDGRALPWLEGLQSEPQSLEASNSLNEALAAGAVSEHQSNLSTAGTFNQSTGGIASAASLGRRTLKIWVTEQGELVPQGRVKRIGPAQDVLNSAEESVYDTLWAARVVASSGDEQSRIVQAGYHFLAKKTRLSKKTIQRIVDKLIQKGFIEIKEQADIYARTSTIYRVFSYTAVKERQRRNNRFYVAKIGPGFTYAYEHVPEHLSTVDTSHLTREVSSSLSTEDKRTTVTVVPRNLSTVVRPTTKEVGRNGLDKTSLSRVREALNEYGQGDDDAVDRVWQKCRQLADDCTEEEIIHFIHQKGALIRGKGSEIYSPIGFLVTAVPKCFAGESFRLYREEQQQRREAEEAAERQRQRELEEWRREQEERLADPNVPEEDKRLLRECLGL